MVNKREHVFAASASVLFLASIVLQLISFLTSHMIVNRRARPTPLHDGLFYRCGAIDFFLYTINERGSFLTHSLDGSIKAYSACFFLNSNMFQRDERKFIFFQASYHATVGKNFYICE
jgi:hypothetical protein